MRLEWCDGGCWGIRSGRGFDEICQKIHKRSNQVQSDAAHVQSPDNIKQNVGHAYNPNVT